MQEEVEQRIVSLMISCGKLGEQEFRKAVAKLLEQLKNDRQKHQYSKANPHGKMTVKQLAAKDVCIDTPVFAKTFRSKAADRDLCSLEAVVRHTDHAVNDTDLIFRVSADVKPRAVDTDRLVLRTQNGIGCGVQRAVHKLGYF